MELKVAAVMTAPRYECTWARNIIQRGLKALDLPLLVSGGVYYGQCMQKMLTDLQDLADVIVTVDGDTIFTSSQLQRLLNIAAQESDVDAITGMQVRRGKKTILGTAHGGVMVGEDEKRVEVDSRGLFQAKTAHFGLTVIKTASLKRTPKPWFWSQPDSNGEWSDNKTDDDVWFWLQWERAGNKVWIDSETNLGHLEEMIVIHDENRDPIHIYPSQWEAANAG